MSEDFANPADVAEQQEEVEPDTVDPERPVAADDDVEVPDDANEADVLEQHQEVRVEDLDDEDDGE
ncbi:hypothetical protein ACFP6A_00175 [Quadrisphaera sp. GCM10027208]|uniref:hypothetical protein n=1 Tax=Quadrisphaera sp. GCM10027208 TaxID=3273423 RepID=UPI00361CC51E|nr:hypothetical protein HJG43_03070 [Kineosporiaceae bacterium SCSIO 59966]